jgi:hypothetical protein
MSQFNLSARDYHRILKRARTIADLAGSDQIQTLHVAEQYRLKGMYGTMGWGMWLLLSYQKAFDNVIHSDLSAR